MDDIENRTLDAIQVGDSASLVRTLTPSLGREAVRGHVGRRQPTYMD